MHQAGAEHGSGGRWFIIAAAMLWGTTGTAQALAPVGASPAAIGALRLFIGGLALLLLAMVRRTLQVGVRWPPLATGLAMVLIAAYQLTFFFGVALTGVAVGTMVAIGSSPIAAGVLGFLVRGERLGPRWYLATAMAIAGCALLVFTGGQVRFSPLGIVLALGAGISYAAYTVTIKGLLPGRSTDAVMAVVFCGAGLLLLPCLLLSDLHWLARPEGLAVALHLGIFTAGLSYFLFARGLRTVDVGVVGTLTLAEPLTATLLGLVVLGERLGPREWAGFCLLFCGIALLALQPLRR